MLRRFVALLACALAMLGCGDETDHSYEQVLTVRVDGTPNIELAVDGRNLPRVSEVPLQFSFAADFDSHDEAPQSLMLEVRLDGVAQDPLMVDVNACDCDLLNRSERLVCLFEDGTRKAACGRLECNSGEESCGGYIE